MKNNRLNKKFIYLMATIKMKYYLIVKNVMSGTPIKIETNQLPYPPIIPDVKIKRSLKKHEPLLKHCKVDDSDQEFDYRAC